MPRHPKLNWLTMNRSSAKKCDAGNRQINRVLHIMAVVQLRHPAKGRACYDRKVAAGKTPMEAMRVLRRMLSTWSAGR